MFSRLLASKTLFYFLVGLAIFPAGIAALQASAAIQRVAFPIVTGFTVEKMDHLPDGSIVVEGSLERHLSPICQYDTVTWSAFEATGRRRAIDWASLNRPREQVTLPPGVAHWGPWQIFTDHGDISAEARADYICFGLFDTYAILGPITL